MTASELKVMRRVRRWADRLPPPTLATLKECLFNPEARKQALPGPVELFYVKKALAFHDRVPARLMKFDDVHPANLRLPHNTSKATAELADKALNEPTAVDVSGDPQFKNELAIRRLIACLKTGKLNATVLLTSPFDAAKEVSLGMDSLGLCFVNIRPHGRLEKVRAEYDSDEWIDAVKQGVNLNEILKNLTTAAKMFAHLSKGYQSGSDIAKVGLIDPIRLVANRLHEPGIKLEGWLGLQDVQNTFVFSVLRAQAYPSYFGYFTGFLNTD